MPSKAAVKIVRELDVSTIEYLDEASASSEDGMMLNHLYFDTRGWGVADVETVLEEECELLESLGEVGWNTTQASEIIDVHFSDWSELAGFDVGVGGAVLALSAAGATPISSCNGGTIGIEHHSSSVPHILFAGSPTMNASAILKAIEAADLGSVHNGQFGEIYADDVLKFPAFARALIDELMVKR